MLPGTPLDLLARIKSFSSRKQPSNRTTDDSYGSTRDELDPLDPLEIASDWGIERTMWAREWGTLSGGEAQRIALAVAVGVGGAEVLLLDGESGSSSGSRSHQSSKLSSANGCSDARCKRGMVALRC